MGFSLHALSLSCSHSFTSCVRIQTCDQFYRDFCVIQCYTLTIYTLVWLLLCMVWVLVYMRCAHFLALWHWPFNGVITIFHKFSKRHKSFVTYSNNIQMHTRLREYHFGLAWAATIKHIYTMVSIQPDCVCVYFFLHRAIQLSLVRPLNGILFNSHLAMLFQLKPILKRLGAMWNARSYFTATFDQFKAFILLRLCDMNCNVQNYRCVGKVCLVRPLCVLAWRVYSFARIEWLPKSTQTWTGDTTQALGER